MVSTLDPFLFAMFQIFGKYAPNLYPPSSNLQIYMGSRLDPLPPLCWDKYPNSNVFIRHPLGKGSKKERKKLELSNFLGDPPPLPPKISLFFFTY